MQQIETGTWFENYQAARAAEAARTASCAKKVLDQPYHHLAVVVKR
jgi:hypothetical protein